MVLSDQSGGETGLIQVVTRIPTYALYGEYLEESLGDVLHFEALRDRSAKHDWSIQLHKHDTLWQFFHLKTSDIVMQLGDEAIHTSTPVIVSIPPLVVHGFQFPTDVPGGVVSVRFPVVVKLLDDLPGSGVLHDRVWLVQSPEINFAPLERTFDNIQNTFRQIDHLRNRGLRANLEACLISFTRHALASTDDHGLYPSSHDDFLLRGFCGLIEDHYRANWTSARYACAAELGVSTVKLNRKCRSILGSSPQRLLTKRRILEAKRLLQFTRHAIAEIADQLGFADTSYFCRLFKKETSQTPAAYRRDNSP